MQKAEPKFLKAVGCGGEVAPKGMMNLSLLYHAKANSMAQGKSSRSSVKALSSSLILTFPSIAGDLKGAKALGIKAADFVDAAKPILEHIQSTGTSDGEINRFINQLKPLRLQCHRIVGQVMAAEGDFASCEKEFRVATESFPNEVGAWQMLLRALEIQGKETKEISERIQALLATRSF